VTQAGKIRIGVGGWIFEPRRGVFAFIIHEGKVRAPQGAMALIERTL